MKNSLLKRLYSKLPWVRSNYEMVEQPRPTVSERLDISWVRSWIAERRRLVHSCLELRADEVRMWECFFEELEKGALEAKTDRERLIDYQRRVLLGQYDYPAPPTRAKLAR